MNEQLGNVLEKHRSMGDAVFTELIEYLGKTNDIMVAKCIAHIIRIHITIYQLKNPDEKSLGKTHSLSEMIFPSWKGED